jgi:hypothetical protein
VLKQEAFEVERPFKLAQLRIACQADVVDAIGMLEEANAKVAEKRVEHERRAEIRRLEHEQELQRLRGAVSGAAGLGRRQVDAQEAELEARIARTLGEEIR